MEYMRYRKYPRVYKKQVEETQEKDNSIILGAATAVGILAFTFINGLTLGYFIKKKLG